LTHRIIDHEDHDVLLPITIDISDRHTRSRVFKRKPIRHIDPRSVTTPYHTGGIQIAAYAKQSAILGRPIIDHEHHKVLLPIPIQTGNGPAASCILGGKPIWNLLIPFWHSYSPFCY
jgi:hypothetical protein